MAQPDLAQARAHHDRQAEISTAAGVAVAALIARKAPWAEVLQLLAAYQLAAATAAVRTLAAAILTEALVRPEMFAGVSSAGFPVSEPLVAALDYLVPAPAEALPDAWWKPADRQRLEEAAARVVSGMVKDAGRDAFQAELVASKTHDRYVRMLVPPSCQRCVVLAGRIYRQLEAFDRHPPTCDCVHWPADSWGEANEAGLVSSPAEAYAAGQIRDLTDAQRKAIDAGADIVQVVNANSGMQTSTQELFGRRIRVTRYGTTRRSAWRKRNPSRRVRLTPGAIYRIADSDADAVRLLQLNGYLPAA